MIVNLKILQDERKKHVVLCTAFCLQCVKYLVHNYLPVVNGVKCNKYEQDKSD